MNNNEKLEELIDKIMEIEKESMKKRFNSGEGKNEKFTTIKADTEVVNEILSLVGEGKRWKNENKKYWIL